MNKRLLEVALGNGPADLILKNGRVVDVVGQTIYVADIAIADGLIAGVGEYDKAAQIIDLHNAIVTPGLINAHLHVESSMATPEVYCAEELAWGVTTLITDPHEIANVAGSEGIRYMLAAGRHMPVNYYVELPSCVPATPFEHSGCVMTAADMAELADEPGVLGMGEMMNVPGVVYGDAEVHAKLDLFHKLGRVVDGHAPMVQGKILQAYLGCGIHTDHESSTWPEAVEKLRSGVAVLIREGSSAHNLEKLVRGLLAEKASTANLAFCTDDKHLADVHREGTVRHSVQMAEKLGLDFGHAIAMATYNAARIYGLKHLGVIAPGKQADLVVWDDVYKLHPTMVFHKGEDALAKLKQIKPVEPPAAIMSSVRLQDFDPDDLVGQYLPDKTYPVIEMLPGEIVTEKGEIKGSEIARAVAEGRLCHIAVLERHHATGHIGLGLLSGYGLQDGAIATTVAHDSHNLIVVGTDKESMATAVKELDRVGGGYTLVYKNKVLRTLKLDVAGLMSTLDEMNLTKRLEQIGADAHAQGVYEHVDPFISLSFMALPVIPKIKITDSGLFDVEKFQFIK